MLPMVLVLLLAWLVLSVLIAALFSFLARRIPREDRDWDGELREYLARGAGSAPLTAVPTPHAPGGARGRRGSSPRRRPEGMAEFRG
jgi:hypothetical protein